MEPNSKDRKVNTQTPVDQSGGKRMPGCRPPMNRT